MRAWALLFLCCTNVKLDVVTVDIYDGWCDARAAVDITYRSILPESGVVRGVQEVDLYTNREH